MDTIKLEDEIFANIPADWNDLGAEGFYPRTQKKIAVPVHVTDAEFQPRYDTEQAIVVNGGDVTIVYDRTVIESYQGATPWRELQRVFLHPRIASRISDCWLEHELRRLVDDQLKGNFMFAERHY